MSASVSQVQGFGGKFWGGGRNGGEMHWTCPLVKVIKSCNKKRDKEGTRLGCMENILQLLQTKELSLSHLKLSLNSSSNSLPKMLSPLIHVCKRVPSLDYECQNNAVEAHPFEVSTLSVVDKLLNCKGSLLCECP